jgi:urease accessory protein
MNSDPVINTEAGWIVGLLQAGDSFYPTGSYAHSFGLEGLVQAGVVHDRESLRKFLLRSALPSLQHVELPLAAHAHRVLGEKDWARVEELCVLSAAVKSSREARRASHNIGRQRAELAAKLHLHPLAIAYLEQGLAGNWPFSTSVSAALEGHVLGAPRAAVLAGVFYAGISGQLAAAMKILRLGQNACQALLTEMLSRAPVLIAAAEQVELDEIGWFNPWLDIAAARHEGADSRLFIS